MVAPGPGAGLDAAAEPSESLGRSVPLPPGSADANVVTAM